MVKKSGKEGQGSCIQIQVRRGGGGGRGAVLVVKKFWDPCTDGRKL